MFQSSTFAGTIASLTGATIEVHNTNGAVGAARAAGIAAGLSADLAAAVGRQEILERISPREADRAALTEAYARWEAGLQKFLA